MAIWKLKDRKEIPEELKKNSLPNEILQILVSRGFDTVEKMNKFLFADYESGMYDPFLFVQMEKVVQRISEAKQKDELVVIFGDYDADGITSSVILKQALDDLGIRSMVYIPDKKKEGYGLNLAAIDQFNAEGVKLIITVDCGITGIKEVEKANSFGIETIITDHHHVPEVLPAAHAIINPHQEGCGYPFADLAGVGVAFKVVQALYERLLPEKKDQTKWMLDVIAIGTVADCVPLIDENRTIVRFGLIVLSKTRRSGLRELFNVGRMIIDESNIPDVRKISFHIAPRINAAGRINHANLAYDLIVETLPAKGRELALELEANNSQRQKITDQIANEIKALAIEKFRDNKFIYAAAEHYSIGVVGLVAGRVAQEFNKPTAVFQQAGNELKGSFRSIPQLNIIETIEKCKDLVLRYGGHSQAAGVTVAADKFESFIAAMNDLIEQELAGRDLQKEIEIDVEASAEAIDFDFVESIEKMKPFGEGNREPVLLMKNMLVHDLRTVGNGNKHTKLSLRPQDGIPKIFEAILFNSNPWNEHLQVGNEIDIVFNIQKDEWNGNNKIQLIVQDLKTSTKA
jgi:single-stranded-DNA-specific exonuclease